MTVFMQVVLKGALAPCHLAKGLWLDESDHGLTLKHTDNDGNVSEIAHWGIYAEMLDILTAADKYLLEKGMQC